MSTEHPIRFAVFGTRHWHVLEIAEAVRSNDAFTLVGLAEPDTESRTAAATQLGVPAITNYQEMLENELVDAIVIGAINDERADIICASLAAGVHVLADKPMVISHEQLRAVEQAAAVSDAVLSCALSLRFTPLFVAAKQAIDRGDIGDVVGSYAQGPHKLNIARRPGWMFERHRYGGTLLDLTIHDVDVARWIHQVEPTMVVADEGSARFGDHDISDYASVYLRMTNETVAICRSSWLTPDEDPTHGDRRLIIEGTEGHLEIVDSATRSLLINKRGTVSSQTAEAATSVAQPDAMAGLVEDFASAIQGNATPVITTFDAIESHRWTIAARDDAESRT